jgi:hypothetical protein
MITGKKRLEWLIDHGVVEPRKRNKNTGTELKIKAPKEPKERRYKNPYDIRSQDALDYAVGMYIDI